MSLQAHLQVLGHIKYSRQFGLVVLFPSHVPFCHCMHDKLADWGRLSLRKGGLNSNLTEHFDRHYCRCPANFTYFYVKLRPINAGIKYKPQGVITVTFISVSCKWSLALNCGSYSHSKNLFCKSPPMHFFIFKIFIHWFYREGGKERYTDWFSTYLCIHWLIFATFPDWGSNLHHWHIRMIL